MMTVASKPVKVKKSGVTQLGNFFASHARAGLSRGPSKMLLIRSGLFSIGDFDRGDVLMEYPVSYNGIVPDKSGQTE